MSNTALKAVTEGKPKKGAKDDLAHMLTSPAVLAQIKAALPRHLTAERMARVAITEIRKTPALGKCDPRTFVGAVIQLSQLGLEPGGTLGHAYLIPFENRGKGTTDVQLIIGYRGMIDLARRSGQIATIHAEIVREGDVFECELGDSPRLKHIPMWDEDKPMTHAYCSVVFKDGSKQFGAMSRSQIEKVRKQSRASSAGPWMTHFEEMAKKTVIRRLFKYLPVSIELQRAVVMDERGDAGLSQMLDDGAIDGESTEVHEDAPQLPHKDVGDLERDPPASIDGDLAGGYTFAQVATAISQAPTADVLDVARDMIPSVANEKHRAELDVLEREKRKGLGA